MYNFESVEEIDTKRGKLIKVRCIRDCEDFGWLLDKDITIDGEKHKALVVEYNKNQMPIKKNDIIGILVNRDVLIEEEDKE